MLHHLFQWMMSLVDMGSTLTGENLLLEEKNVFLHKLTPA